VYTAALSAVQPTTSCRISVGFTSCNSLGQNNQKNPRITCTLFFTRIQDMVNRGEKPKPTGSGKFKAVEEPTIL
jgi:hypothetical protein